MLDEQQPAAPYPPTGRELSSTKTSTSDCVSTVLSSEEAAVQHADCNRRQSSGDGGGESSGISDHTGARRRGRGRGKKKRGGRRRITAAQRAVAREKRDYIAVHKRFFKNFAHALMHAVIDPDTALSPNDTDSDDPDYGLSRAQIIREWSQFYEDERLEKGYDLTREERSIIITAMKRFPIEKIATHVFKPQSWEDDVLCEDDNENPWDTDGYCGENLVVF